MQVVHATFYPGEGKKAVKLIKTLGVDLQDYKLIESKTGDLLIINLLYDNTDVLIDNLESNFDFKGDKKRSLIIYTADTIIPRDEKKQKKVSFHVTRESLVTFAQTNSQLNLKYVYLIIFSSIIISLGLILGNVAVVVGGMVIAPVLGPLLAITIGIVLGNFSIIKQGMLVEIVGIIIAIAIGMIFSLIIPVVEINESLRMRMFPTLADLLIAAAAGGAAAYALIKGQKETGLIGVMVAAALLPVMSTIGIGIGLNNKTMIIGATLLLLGNLLALIFANIIVLYLEGLKPQIWYKNRAKKIVKRSLIFITVAVILLSIPLGFLTIYQFYIEKPVDIIRTTIKEHLQIKEDYRIERIDIATEEVTIYLYAITELDEDILYNIKKEISRQLARDYDLNFRLIPITEISIK